MKYIYLIETAVIIILAVIWVHLIANNPFDSKDPHQGWPMDE